MFADQLEKSMEVYINDMLVKFLIAEQYIDHLKQSFEILKKYNVKLNPSKCSFIISSVKFLGYLVTQQGIEANPDQIYSTINILSPACIKEVQRFSGRLAAPNRFISRSSEKCQKFYNILRKKELIDFDM